MKKIKKSRVLWLGRDMDASGIDLYSGEPSSRNVDGCYYAGHNSFRLRWFCDRTFRRLFPIGMRKGQKKKVKITIEVIE